MKMNYKNKLLLKILVVLVFSVHSLFAQDIHFSQFNNSPLNLNAAYTGAFHGDYRIVANHKRQWLYFTNAYKTYSASFDAKIHKIKLKKGEVNAGVLINSDLAGDGDFGMNSLNLSSSYHFFATKDSSLKVMIGLLAGFSQYSLNFNQLTFNNQWNGSRYIDNSATGESIVDNSMLLFNISSGMAFLYKINPKINLQMAYASAHLNQPEKSLYQDNTSDLSIRHTVNAALEIQLSRNLNLQPSVYFSRQGKLQELSMGGMLKIFLDDVNIRAIYLGSWLRYKDAGVFLIGVDYNKYRLGLSYDINISNLNIASNGRGGIEISLVYIFNKAIRYKIPYYKKCPTFL